MYEEYFEPFKKALEASKINLPDDEIRAMIKQRIEENEASVGSKINPPVDTWEALQGKITGQIKGEAEPEGSDQNAVMDFLGNTLWGATEGGSWGLMTGINLATGGDKVSKAISLGYSDPWAEESFAGKAGYILGNSIGALAGFILSGGALSAASAGVKLGSPALARLGGLSLREGGEAVAKALGEKALYSNIKREAGEEFFESIAKKASDDVLKINKGWWWNKTLRNEIGELSGRPLRHKMKRAIARQELSEQATERLEKTILEDLQKRGLASTRPEINQLFSRGLAKEALKAAHTYNSRNFNMALTAKFAQGGKALGRVEDISKSTQALAAGTAEALVFGVHTLGDNIFRNIGYNVFAENKRLVDHSGKDLTAGHVIKGLLVSLVTGAALGPIRFTGKGKIVGQEVVSKYKTWTDKALDPITVEAATKLGILKKDLPAFFSSLKRRLFPRRYNLESKEGQEAVIAKANLLMKMSDDELVTKLPKGLSAIDLARIPGEAVTGPKSLKEIAKLSISFLKKVEKDFNKEIGPWLVSEMGRDIWDSLGRMIRGSMIMNTEAFIQNKMQTNSIWGEDPKETIAHILTGMFFTKRKHTFLGGEKTVYYDMARYRKYVNGLEVLGFDTKEMHRYKALMGTTGENARRIMIRGDAGVQAMNKAFSDKDGISFLLNKEEKAAKDLDAARAGEILNRFSTFASSDKDLSKAEKTELIEIYDSVEAGLRTRLHHGKSIKVLRLSEYKTIKKNLLSKEMVINGNKLTAENAQGLVLQSLNEATVRVTKVYEDLILKFNADIAKILGVRRNPENKMVIAMDEGVKKILENMKNIKEGREFDRKRIQEAASLVLEAVNMAQKYGLVQYKKQTEGLRTDVDLEKGEQIETSLSTALETLHSLQYGNVEGGDWRVESFNGLLKDKTNKSFMLRDRFADKHMLNQTPIYRGVISGLLWTRNNLTEKIFSMDKMTSESQSLKLTPEDRSMLNDLNVKIKDIFANGPIFIETESGNKSTSSLNKVLERMYKAHALEHPNPSKTEEPVEEAKAKDFIEEVEKYVGDLFRSDESFQPFMNYLNDTSIDRIYEGSPLVTYGARAALVELIRSELPVVHGDIIYLPTIESVKLDILSNERITKTRKTELIKFYEEWYDKSENAGRLQKSTIEQEFDSDVLLSTLGSMEMVYHRQKINEHVKEIDKFRVNAARISSKLEDISTQLNKDLVKAKSAFDVAFQSKHNIDASKANVQEFEDKQKLVDSLKQTQAELFSTYSEALAHHDWVILNSLLGANIARTWDQLRKDLNKVDADLDGIAAKYTAEHTRMITDAMSERNKIFSKTSLDYNKIVDSKIPGVDEFHQRESHDVSLNPAKFAQSHGLTGRQYDNYFALTRASLDIVKTYVQKSAQLTSIINQIQQNWKKSSGRSSYVIEELFRINKRFLPMYANLISDRIRLANMSYNKKTQKTKVGVRETNKKKIYNDVMTLMRRELQQKKIGIMTYENGKLIKDFGVYAHSDYGVSGLWDRLDLDRSNSVFIFTEKAAVGGRAVSYLTESVINDINNKMSKKIEVENVAELKDSVHEDLIKQIEEPLVGFGEDGKPTPFIMTLDGKTHLVVFITDQLQHRIVNAFEAGGHFRERLETLLASSVNSAGDRVITGKAKQYLEYIDKKLGVLKEPTGKSMQGPIREMFYLSRLLIDASTKLKVMIETGEVLPDIHKLFKYVNTLSPKGVSVNDATLEGTRLHIDSMVSIHKKGSKEQKQWKSLRGSVERATKDQNNNDRGVKIIPIIDEQKKGGQPSSYNEGSKEFFDVYELTKESARRENNRIYQDEKGNFSEEIFEANENIQELKKASKSNVDGEMFVSLDLMVTHLFARGEGMESFIFNKDGKIVGVNWGAVKPNIWHNEVNPTTGEVTLFTGKTAMKYRPSFSKFFEHNKVDALMFESSNKYNEYISGFGKDIEERYVQLELNSLIAGNKFTYESNRWETLLLEGLNNYQYLSDQAIEIPHSSFLLRSTARPHDAVLSRATYTFLDEKSLKEVSEWIGQDHNVKVAQGLFSAADDMLGLSRVARYLNERKEPGATSDELVDTIINGGHAMPMSLQGTINQQIMTALNRAGNFTSEAREGAYSIMTAGNGLSFAIHKDGTVRKFGGSGMSHYAADKKVHFYNQNGAKRKDAVPSIITTIGDEDIIIGKNNNGDIEFLNRGDTIEKENIEIGKLVLRKLGLNQLGGGKELYTQKQKEEIADIVKEILKDTYMDMQSMNRESLVSELIHWIDGTRKKDFKEGSDVIISNGSSSQSYKRNELLQGKLTKIIQEIITRREKLIKEINQKIKKDPKNDQLKKDKNQLESDKWKILRSAIKKNGVLSDRLIEGFWLTKIDLRIPKDSIEGVLLTKTEKILSRLRGSVSEMNGADAILIQDADFDLDKSVEWWGMPWPMVKNFNKMSGYAKYADGGKIKYEGETRTISMLGDVDKILSNRLGADKQFGKLRAGIISAHHLISFLANLSDESQQRASLEKVGARAGETPGHEVESDRFGEVKIGEDVHELTLLQWQEGGLNYRVNLSAGKGFINSIHHMKNWLKLVMDVDNASRPDFSKMSQTDILDSIFFNSESGFFQLTSQPSGGAKRVVRPVLDWGSASKGQQAQDAIKNSILSPMRKLFSLLDNKITMADNNVRSAMPYDYAEVLGRIRKDMNDIKFAEPGTEKDINLKPAASFILKSLRHTNHPYLKSLNVFADQMSKVWIDGEKNHPLADLIFTKNKERLFGEEYGHLERVAAQYIGNQKRALDLNALDWAINSIKESMDYFASQSHGDPIDHKVENGYAKEWRRLKKDLEAKKRLRETLSYALTYDIAMGDLDAKLTSAKKVFSFNKDNEGKFAAHQVTVNKDKYKTPILIYRSASNIDNSRFEIVKPGETSNMFVKHSDTVLINPRRYEYVQDAEQQGLQSMFRAFARRVDGLGVFQHRYIETIKNELVDEIKSAYFDSHGGVDFKNKTATDWQRYEMKILNKINNSFKRIEREVEDATLAENYQKQLVYEMMRPDVDTNVIAVSYTVDGDNKASRRYSGQKYFNNGSSQKAILKWLNNIANGSRRFNNGGAARRTSSVVMTPLKARDLFDHVMDLYTNHSRNVYDSFLPEEAAQVSFPATYKNKRETGYLPRQESPDWHLKGTISKSAEASIFADYLLGLHVMSPNMLYDLSLTIGKQLAARAGKQDQMVIDMAKGGNLGRLITDVWSKEKVTVDKYGRQVEPESYRSVTKYLQETKARRSYIGQVNSKGLSEADIDNKFEPLKDCLTGKK